MSAYRARRLLGLVFLLHGFLLHAALPAPAQRKDAPQWKLEPDDYVGFTIDGMIGIRHLGFFGYDLAPGGKLLSEPEHPAFLSLPLVAMLPPGKPKKGAKFTYSHVFTHFENYTPVRVGGVITVQEVIGPLLFLEGNFKLKKERAHGKDGRWYQITKGKLQFQSQFDMNNGMLREATVKFGYTYDTRIALEALYTGGGLKQDRNVDVSLPHEYRLNGVLPRKDMQEAIDLWVDETAARLLDDWGGTGADGHNYALKPAYDSLYVLALLHAKVPKKNPVVEKVMKRIREAPIHSTYGAALLLMVLEAMNTSTEELLDPRAYHDKPPQRDLSTDDRRLAAKAVRYLVKGQLAGGWTYVAFNDDKKFFPTQIGDPDNSNTQFALMGLYAAARMGARIDAKVWRKALGFWKRNLTKKGYRPIRQRNYLVGWSYSLHGRGTAYQSMTTGGLASLSIIAAGLGVKPGDKTKEGTTIGRLMGIGLDWMEYFYSVRTCKRAVLPGPDLTSYWAYHLYALERACDLGRLTKIGRHDWYLEGAMAILNDTYEDVGRDHVYEALCLLFLDRSTPPAVTDPVR